VKPRSIRTVATSRGKNGSLPALPWRRDIHKATGRGNVAIWETVLYAPICSYLKNQGYEVKGEVEHCDLVAIRGDEPPLIVELKTKLNLELILQAADRLILTESVYIAFPASAALWRRNWRRVRLLCRRLGIGIMTLDGRAFRVNVRLDPLPYRPIGSQVRRHRLLAEFERRVGDANIGGVTRKPIMTLYRQDALRCVVALADGPLSIADVREASQVTRAGGILQKDHYGWFERVRRGHYRLSQKGVNASIGYANVISELVTPHLQAGERC